MAPAREEILVGKVEFQDSPRTSEDTLYAVENQSLLYNKSSRLLRIPHNSKFTHFCILYTIIFAQLVVLVRLWANSLGEKCRDSSLKTWSPANEAVEYVVHPFRAAMFNKTEYMGFPTDETDQLWSDLYNFGTSVISEEDAKKLEYPTIPIPGTDRYLIQLDVWHQLHCLNDLRKILYPERFPEMSLDSVTVNGTIDRDTDGFRHWDHCIDALRQALMCNADVSPISFHVNVPVNAGVFPRLATMHTCRNFTKIQEWARNNRAGHWEIEVTPEQADEIIQKSGYDHGPLEDIEFLWYLFPGNKFFKHWREHPLEEEQQVPSE